MISALAWIPKGIAKPVPEKFEMSEEKYAEIMQRTTVELEEAREGLEEVKKLKKSKKKAAKATTTAPAEEVEEQEQTMMEIDENLAKFNLSDYDEEDGGVFDADENSEDVLDLFMQDVKGMVKSASSEDPYLSKENDPEADASDEDDIRIRPTDSLVVTCKTADDVSYLEVNLYEENEGNHYVHHDVMLPTFPLCVEPISFPFKDPENPQAFSCHAAVGTFDPEIEIWDLDLLDAAYPAIILGSQKKTSGSGKSKKPTSKKPSPHHHVDAVMSLAWNKQHRNMLLSGSADKSIKLWDLNTATCIKSFDHHKDKVQVVQWNPAETTKIISASYDGSITFFDARSPNDQVCWRGLLTSDVEALKWNPHQPHCFAVSEESGLVHYVDARMPSAHALFKLQAHAKATTSLDWHPIIPDCLLTASVDKSFKIWKTSNSTPTAVISREPEVGKLFSAAFCPDSTFLVSAAGSRGELRFFNLAKNEAIVEAFAAA